MTRVIKDTQSDAACIQNNIVCFVKKGNTEFSILSIWSRRNYVVVSYMGKLQNQSDNSNQSFETSCKVTGCCLDRIWRGVKLLSKDLRSLRVTYLRHGRHLSPGGCPI